MNYGLLDLFTLIGSVGLFLFGMKLMSEGLQKAAGDKLRNILALMTNNRIVGALTGIILNAILPGKDYVFDTEEPQDTGVDFEVGGRN